MHELIVRVSDMLAGSGGIVVAAAFAWGIMSVLLSPCSLVFIPLVVGYVDSQEGISTRRAFLLSCLFSLGVMTNLALVGVIVASAGKFFADIGRYSSYIVAFVFFFVGMHLWEVIKIPGFTHTAVRTKQNGIAGALLLGLFSGLAVGPCSLAYVAPLMVLLFQEAETNLPFAGLILAAYVFGYGAILVFCGTMTEFVHKFLHWDEKSQGTKLVNRVCGVLIIAAGLFFIYHAP